MSKCINCKYLKTRTFCFMCEVRGQIIKYPRLMGGPKKCECYEKRKKIKEKFEYPKKEIKENESGRK